MRASDRYLAAIWRTDTGEHAVLTGAEPPVVLTSRTEAEAAIGASPHLVGVRVTLSVVFPEANGANVVPTVLSQGEISAARAAMGTSRLTLDDGIRV
jgi:hypothetical protein